MLAAGRANFYNAKLPMSSRERQNFAWKLVVLNKHSKRDIKEAAGVSDGQLGIMRRTHTKLGKASHECTSWFQARRKANGIPDIPEDQREKWKERLADHYAKKLMKAVGPKFRSNPEIAAMTIERYFGRRLEELAHELRTMCPMRM